MMTNLFVSMVITSVIAIIWINLSFYFEIKMERIPDRWIEYAWFLLCAQFLLLPSLLSMTYSFLDNTLISILCLIVWVFGAGWKAYQMIGYSTEYFPRKKRSSFQFKYLFVSIICIVYWFHPLVQKAAKQYCIHVIFADDHKLVQGLSRDEKIQYALYCQNCHGQYLSSDVMRKRMELILQDKNMNFLRFLLVLGLYLVQLVWVLCIVWQGVVACLY